MDDYGHLTRDDLVALVRRLQEAQAGGARAGEPGDFQAFSELLRERRNAEELLWLREQEFERLAENIPDLVARFDRDHRYVYVNTAVERTLGLSRDTMMGKTQRALGMPGELATKFEHSLDEVVRTGDVHVIEFSLKTLQGERFFDAYHVPEGGMRHRVETVLCVARDITARKQVEAAQGRLAAIVSSTSDAIIGKNLDGVIQTWNPGAERLFGYTVAEAVGRPITMLIPPERLEEETLILERIRSGEHVEHFESVRCAKDGKRVQVSLSMSPILGSAGKPVGASTIARDITERKLGELAAHRSAALAKLLESLARAANEAVSPEAAMTACLQRICGYGRWVIGRVVIYDTGTPKTVPLRSIWHTADKEKFVEVIRVSNDHAPHPASEFLGRALREQAAVWIEDLGRVPGFNRKEVLLKCGLRSAFAFPVIVHGDVIAIMEVFSEEPRAQDALTIGAAQSIASQLARIVERDWAHQANARMAAIVESSRDAIISRRLDGTILTWNPGAERMLGYSAAEMVGRDVRSIIPPEFHDRMQERQEQIAQGNSVPGHETVRITRDRRRIDVATTSSPIRDASGRILAISTIIRDITQRKRREQDLRESEERFRQLAENIEQVFWINTPGFEGTIYVSPAYEKVWGRSRESLRSDPNNWMASVHPDDLAGLREALSGIARGRQLDIEYRIVRPDGGIRWIRDRSYPMTRGDGTPLLCGLAEDITEQKRVAAEQLEQAVRQRDALVREVHHRIKNSLQGVAGLLRQKIGKYPALAPGIEEAISQLQSVALVYGLQGARTDGLLTLAEVTDAICASAESLIGGRVERTFERRSLRSACIAGSEAVSVAVALNELVFNALKHQRAAAGKKRARVELSEARGTAEIRISNRGRLPREFDFASGRAVGNGLGLVRTLLVAPGGSVAFNGRRNEVEVVLKLSPPLLAERGKAAPR
jgi:PAS domain S-box-containing protein